MELIREQLFQCAVMLIVGMEIGFLYQIWTAGKLRFLRAAEAKAARSAAEGQARASRRGSIAGLRDRATADRNRSADGSRTRAYSKDGIEHSAGSERRSFATGLGAKLRQNHGDRRSKATPRSEKPPATGGPAPGLRIGKAGAAAGEIAFWLLAALITNAFLYYCAYGEASFHSFGAFCLGAFLWKKIFYDIIA